MRRLFLLLAGVICFSVGHSVPAHAQVDCLAVTVPAVIVGNSSGVMIGSGFIVEVRSINNTAMVNWPVTVYFNDSSMKPHSSQVSPTTVNCQELSITKNTNGSGLAIFTPRLGGYENLTNVEVWVQGGVLGPCIVNIKGRSTDLDNDGDTDLSDYSIFANLLLTGPYDAQIDYDQSGTEGVGDLGVFSAELLRSASGSLCP